MNNYRYVAAIEISSSKIIASVGKTDSEGRLTIVAVEQMKGLESVRFGIIQNAEETASRINNIIDRLERRPDISPRKIDKVFVSIAGRSMRSISAETRVRLPEESEITAIHLEDLRSQALNWPIESSLEVVDAIPRSYIVGTTETQNPIGIIGEDIKATFDLIVCRRQIKKNITHTISGKTGLEIANFVVTPVAVSHLILKPEEKRLGCMLVDMGAETTTVMIFKDNHIRYFVTLPLGSRNITRDIISLNILEERAEEIKKSSGCAIAPEIPTQIDLDGVPMTDISNRIVARSEEIVANILEQIHEAGFTSADLPGGIIAIGGGFKLSGMVDLITTMSNLKVSRGSLPSYVTIEDTKAPASEVIEVASILYAAATLSETECLSQKEVTEMPRTGEEPDPENESGYPEDNKGRKNRPQKPSVWSSRLSRLRDKLAATFTGEKDGYEDDSEIE